MTQNPNRQSLSKSHYCLNSYYDPSSLATISKEKKKQAQQRPKRVQVKDLIVMHLVVRRGLAERGREQSRQHLLA